MKYLICNLKENKTINEILIYEHELRKLPKGKTKLIVCPSAPFLPYFQKDNYEVGAQDVSIFKEGAYTGEVSAKQLASLHVHYSMIGHSERKTYFHEKEQDYIVKIANSFEAGLEVIYIVGENEEEKDIQFAKQAVERQLARVLNAFSREKLKNIILVYEPAWAVNTDVEIDFVRVKEMCHFIKELISSYYELDLPVLYGGSVNEKNYESFLALKEIDGLLLGKLSLDISKVTEMYQRMTKIDNN